MRNFSYPKNANLGQRHGAAVVELAISLPILITFMLGTIEFCNSLTLRKSLTVAAYEGSMVSILPGASSADVEDAIMQTLEDRGVTHYSISISPPNLEAAPAGTFISVSVSAPYAFNCVVYQGPFSSFTLTGQSTFTKEN